jgi:hypothetical protein
LSPLIDEQSASLEWPAWSFPPLTTDSPSIIPLEQGFSASPSFYDAIFDFVNDGHDPRSEFQGSVQEPGHRLDESTQIDQERPCSYMPITTLMPTQNQSTGLVGTPAVSFVPTSIFIQGPSQSPVTDLPISPTAPQQERAELSQLHVCKWAGCMQRFFLHIDFE